MERDIYADSRLDWPEIVANAKRRRQQMKLTQRRLAAVSGVSLPTVVQFEAGKDVRISSALAILKVLELVATPVEGLLTIHGAGAVGSYSAMFAPYGGPGSGGAVEPHTLTDHAALDVFLDALGIEAIAKQRIFAGLARDNAADLTGVRISNANLRRYWPTQFGAAKQ